MDDFKAQQEAYKARGELFLRQFMANQKPIYAYILSLVANPVDADDLFQETMMVCWRKLESFQPGTDFVRWAVTIARYLVLDYRRTQARRACRFVDDQLLDAIETHFEESQVQIQDQLDALKDCITKLDPKAQRLIHMRFDNGQPISGIATQFRVSVQAIYKSMAKIHGQLLRCVRVTLAGGTLEHG